MGSKYVFMKTGIALLLASFATIGCQEQESAPLRLSVASDDVVNRPTAGQLPTEPKDAPYTNPNWNDDDGSDTPSVWAPLGIPAVRGAWTATVSVAAAPFNALFDAVGSTKQWLTGDRPSAADKLLEDSSNPDNRREGMNKLVDFGFLKNPIFVKRCRQIAEYDTDFTVRGTAIRTGNRARDDKGTSVFIKGLGDSTEWVRLESAKALANVPDPQAVDPLVNLLASPEQSKDVRVAAADALKHYRTLTAARALCTALTDRNFVIAWQAHRSLRYLTSKDFGYDESAWLAYFTGPEKPLG